MAQRLSALGVRNPDCQPGAASRQSWASEPMSPTKDKRMRESKFSPRDATDAELAERLIGIADADPGLSGREQAVID